MTSIIKITSLTLLVVFVGLLGFSLVVDSMASQHIGHADCFGAGCGPVEHAVMHHYIVSNGAEKQKDIVFYQHAFVTNESTPEILEINVESPPPKFSLV